MFFLVFLWGTKRQPLFLSNPINFVSLRFSCIPILSTQTIFHHLYVTLIFYYNPFSCIIQTDNRCIVTQNKTLFFKNTSFISGRKQSRTLNLNLAFLLGNLVVKYFSIIRWLSELLDFNFSWNLVYPPTMSKLSSYNCISSLSRV